MLKGIPASPGIAIGKILLKEHCEMEIGIKKILNYESELERLKEAIEISKTQIDSLYLHALESIGKNEAQIFQAHKMILEDPELFSQVESKIKTEKVNAEWAVKNVADYYVEMFKAMEDEYMRERAADIKDVTDRVVSTLMGVEITDFSSLKEEVIIVAKDLTPSDTAGMDKQRVMGFVTAIGGRTSHSAIMARTLEIPAVVGVDDILGNIKNGDTIVFDGEEGIVYLNPKEEIISMYQKKKEEQSIFREKLQKLVGKKSISKDGVEVELAANIGTPADLEGVLKNDAQGIGLYRSEFLYMDREKLPSEEEQFEAYKAVAEGMNGKPVVIRTLDIGGDKKLPYLKLQEEMNPFLGYRAIRICLDKKDIFKTQLRALLKASAFGNIKIMFPMISSIEELRKAKAILKEVKEELREKNIDFDNETEIGIMVEIPATAVLSDLFAKEVDFFSIGTNDLIQYTTAVDRMNQKISHLYSQYHPSLLRLIKTVIDNGHKEGIWVGMCGEVAGEPKLIPILLGMGLDEFSMSPVSILKARWIIRSLDTKKMKKLANQVLHLPTAEDVERFIDENINLEV